MLQWLLLIVNGFVSGWFIYHSDIYTISSEFLLIDTIGSGIFIILFLFNLFALFFNKINVVLSLFVNVICNSGIVGLIFKILRMEKRYNDSFSIKGIITVTRSWDWSDYYTYANIVLTPLGDTYSLTTQQIKKIVASPNMSMEKFKTILDLHIENINSALNEQNKSTAVKSIFNMATNFIGNYFLSILLAGAAITGGLILYQHGYIGKLIGVLKDNSKTSGEIIAGGEASNRSMESVLKTTEILQKEVVSLSTKVVAMLSHLEEAFDHGSLVPTPLLPPLIKFAKSQQDFRFNGLINLLARNNAPHRNVRVNSSLIDTPIDE
jgi:hypothetical protein